MNMKKIGYYKPRIVVRYDLTGISPTISWSLMPGTGEPNPFDMFDGEHSHKFFRYHFFKEKPMSSMNTGYHDEPEKNLLLILGTKCQLGMKPSKQGRSLQVNLMVLCFCSSLLNSHLLERVAQPLTRQDLIFLPTSKLGKTWKREFTSPKTLGGSSQHYVGYIPLASGITD